MAGRGSRMRPHTLTIPKPLLPVAGKPIVQRLVEDLAATVDQKLEEVAFIIGDFGKEVEAELMAIAEKLGAKGTIVYQDEPLGTAHAIMCAKDSLKGNVIVAFADTLFTTDFKIDPDQDGVIWVKQVDDPSAFGVVKMNEDRVITDFVEKPTEFVSDLAIIGIYYFSDGEYLRSELQYLLDNNIKDRGEFQLTDALENMKQKGTQFIPGKVDEWLDCGNYKATVYTNQRKLEHEKDTNLVAASATIEDAVVLPPCYIGDNVTIKNSVIGPHVSIGDNTKVDNAVISNSIIQSNTQIENRIFANSMVGNHVVLKGEKEDISIGDFTTLQ